MKPPNLRKGLVGTAAAATVILAAAVTLFGGHESPQPTGLRFEFVKIVDTDTPVPGGTGTFRHLGQLSLSAGMFAFRGRDQDLREGIYVGRVDDPTTLRVAYDTTTPIPGGTGTFESFGTPSLSYGKLAFRAGAGLQGGVYTDATGTLEPLADRNTPIPGGTGNFVGFSSEAWLYRGEVVFQASGTGGQGGIYTNSGGTLRVVASSSTQIPGGAGQFTNFGFGGPTPAIRDGVIVFRGGGAGGHRGVYKEANGLLEIVADTNTTVPGGTSVFISFESSFGQAGSVEGDTVMFVGSGNHGEEGLYASVGGILSAVVDRNTLVPDLPSGLPPLRFTSLGAQGFGLHNGKVSFLGDNFFTQGVYTTLGGSLRKVVTNGDLLEGRASNSFGTYGESLYGNAVAFLVGNFGGAEAHASFAALLVRDVAVDIKPRDSVNAINPRSRGVIPVAILSESDFDATTAIVPASLRFGRHGTEPSLSQCGAEDANGDGLADLVCYFFTQDAGFQPGDTEGILTGETIDKIPLNGRDAIRIVGR